MKKRVIIASILCIATLLLFFLYYHIAVSIPQNSDNASAVLEAKSMLDGNIFLKGWTIPIDNFITTDVMYMVPLVAIKGAGDFAMRCMPTIIFIILVILSLISAGLLKKGKEKYLSMATTTLIIAIPSGSLLGMALLGPAHTGTLICVFVAMLSAYFATQQKQKYLWFCLLFIAAFLGSFADPLFLTMAVIPIALVSIIHLYEEGWEEKKLDGLIILVSLIAILATALLRNIITKQGGVVFAPQNFVFTTISGILPNLYLMLQATLQLFGADLTGKHFNDHGVKYMIAHLSFVFLFIGSMLVYAKQSIARKTNRFDELLFLSIIIDFAAILVSRFPVDLSVYRYIFPVFFFGTILTARLLSRYLITIKTYYAYLGVLFIVFAVEFFTTYRYAQPYDPAHAQVESYLLSHHLYNGYGYYWDASIMSVDTSEKLHVGGVTTSASGLQAYHWLSQESYYTNPAHYLIFDTTVGPTAGFYQDALATFGKPDSIKKIGVYEILIWKKNISPLLPN